MPTTINFKPGLDLPRGRPVGSMTTLIGAGGLQFLYYAYDMRGRGYAHPIAITPANGGMYGYNMKTDTFFIQTTQTPNGAGSYGISYSCAHVLAPSQGPSGTLTTGNTTTQVVISTALPGSVRANQLANRGDGLGYIIRIIGNSAGGSGKTEERRIIGNTSGTTPTIQLSEPLSFTPASGDRYEILSGRLYLLASGSTTTGSWRFWDVATQSVSANLSNTNQPNISSSIGYVPQMLALDEAYVPFNRNPGEGFLVGAGTYDASSVNWSKGCLTATLTGANVITGQLSGGDASVLANEYRNFQIRIVEDTGTPTAVGQRRRITSHTAGASAVYTLASNWTVTPSSTAKFVIENDTDKIILWSSGQTLTYNWNITAGTWDTTTWAARTTAHTAGQAHQAFSIVPDDNKNVRQSFIYSHRNSNTPVFDILDIAGGATGAWTTAVTPATSQPQLQVSTIATGAQVPWTQEGRYYYIQLHQQGSGAFGVIYRFDMKTQTFESYVSEALPAGSSYLSGIGQGGFAAYYLDGSTYVSLIYFNQSRSANGQLCQYPILS